MQFDSPSRGTPRQVFLGTDAVGYTGTVILGNGSSSGSVFVPGRVLARIAARAAMRAAMGSAAERGGLLIGPKQGSTDLTIDEALSVSAEYVFTRSLVAAFGAFDAVKKAIANAQLDDAKCVLGVYRIRAASNQPLVRTEFDILDEIRESHRALLSIRVCLVIEAAVGHELPMRVLIRTAGGWEERQQIGLFMGPDPAANGPEAAESAPLSFPARTPSPDAPPSALAPPAWKTRAPYGAPAAMRTAILLSASGLLLAGAASAYRWIDLRRSPAAETRPQSPPRILTGFSANPDGASWKLTWNSAAVMAANPTGASLLIQDGADEQDIALTIPDLSSGTMYYTPKNGDLIFRLQLRRDGASVAEDQVRVLDRVPTISQYSHGRQFAGAGTFTGSQRTINRTPMQPSSRSDDLAPLGLRERPIANNVRTFVPPKPRLPPQPESNPILAAAGPLPEVGLAIPPSVSTSFQAPPPPSQPPAAARIAPPDAVTSPQPQAGAPNSTSVSTAPNNIQAPRAIKQVQPLPPSDARVTGVAEVTVLVSIDANGRVTKATPVGHGADFSLTTAATQAALFWQFEPGRLNGKAVPSQMNLTFRFRALLNTPH